MSFIVNHHFPNEDSCHDHQTEAIPTDTILTCQGKAFKVHRRFLARKSEYFHVLFERDFNIQIEITDMSKEVLDVIITSIYCDRFPTMNNALIPDSLVIFQKIKYEVAYEWYLKIHLKYLSKHNWETFWELGEKLNEDRIFKAVSNLIRYNYNLPQFLLSQMQWKLFTYLSNNRDYEILVKIALCFTRDLESINPLISLIDFGELQDHYISLVSRHPLLSLSPAFRDNGFPILCERFQCLTENYFVKESVGDLILLGQDKDKSVVIIMYSSGTWKQILEMNKEDFRVFRLSVNRRQLNVFSLQNNENDFLHHTVYSTNMCRERETVLGSTFQEAQMSTVDLDDTIIGTVYDYENQCEFLSTGPKYTKYLSEKPDAIIGIQLVRCRREVYMVKQVEIANEQYTLIIYKLSSLEKDREWVRQKLILQEDFSPNWFAYYFPPSKIAVRFVELNTTLYYNFETEIFKWVPENNMIMGAVSMDVFRSHVVCLASDGFVYYQDIWDPDSNWKTLRKCPVNLTRYQQVICVKSL